MFTLGTEDLNTGSRQCIKAAFVIDDETIGASYDSWEIIRTFTSLSELCSITTLNEEGVRIVAIRQEDAASGDALRPETACESLRSLLADAVGIDIKSEIDGARTVAHVGCAKPLPI